MTFVVFPVFRQVIGHPNVMKCTVVLLVRMVKLLEIFLVNGVKLCTVVLLLQPSAFGDQVCFRKLVSLVSHLNK